MKEWLEKIDYSIPDNKHKMNDLFEMAMCSAYDNDRELYDHAKCEIYEMVYGKTVSDDMAEKWVNSMEPKAKWTKGEVQNVITSYGLAVPINCAYVLMNMLYSDSANIYGSGDDSESIKRYAQGVKDWFNDIDSKIKGEEKLYNYYKYIYNV